MSTIAPDVSGYAHDVESPSRQRCIQTAMTARVTVVLGPPGCGKSTALRTCGTLTSAMWYRVGHHGSTFVSFVRGLSQAVAAVSAGAQTSFARAWERSLEAAYPEHALAHWIGEHLGTSEVPVVFDDLHNATENPSIAAFIAAFVELRAPRRVIICARVPGALPLALWLATGTMHPQVDERGLRLDETDAIGLALKLGYRLAPQRAEQIVAETNGLAIAVRYAVLHYGDTKSPAALPTSWRDIIAAVFARRSLAEREILLSCSMFFSINPELRRSLKQADVENVRATMAQDAAFLWDLAATGTSRLHDSVHTYLGELLAASDEGERRSLAIRSVFALEAAGHAAAAVRVAAQQYLPDELERLIDDHGFALYESGHIDIVSEALTVLDGTNGAVATALRGCLESGLGRLDTSEAWFSLGLERAGREVERATIALYYARDLMHRRRADAAGILEPYADLTGLPPALQLDIRSAYGQALVIAGNVIEGAHRTDNVVEELRNGTFSRAAHARILVRAAYVALQSGAIETARERATAALPLAASECLYDASTSAYSVLYNIAADFDDDARASMRNLLLLRDAGAKAGTLRADLYAAIAMYELYAEAGNRDEIKRIDRVIARFDVHFTTQDVTEGLLPAKALQAGWLGEFEHAYRMLRPTVEHQTSRERKALRWATIGLYAAGAGNRRSAHDAIRNARELLTSESAPTLRQDTTVVLLGLTSGVLGEREHGRNWLHRVSPLVERSPRIRALRDAVACIWDDDRDVARHAAAIRAALMHLHQVGFGGFALLIEALPGGTRSLAPQTIARVLTNSETDVRRAPAAFFPAAPSGVWAPAEQTALDDTLPVDEIDVRIDAYIRALDEVAPLMAEHSRAVSVWCARLARKLGLTPQEIVFVTRCGLIHDIGKIRTPGEILNAPRRLTPAEWAIMQAHAADGATLISRTPALRPFVPIVRGHHERLDGRGYPDGLRTSAIPLAARIVTVADCFNAMIGRRLYQRARVPNDALDELYRHRNTQFDPEIVDAMIDMITCAGAHGQSVKSLNERAD